MMTTAPSKSGATLVRTPRPPLSFFIMELWRFRELLRQLVAREIKVRYKNSVLGFLWSVVPLLLQMGVYSFVFRGVLDIYYPNYSAYLLCGLIPWTFFSTAILDSGQSLLINHQILRKIYLPREIFPLSSVMSNFIHFTLNWTTYFVVFFLGARVLNLFFPIDYGLPLLPSLLWFPIITFFLTLLVAGLSLWISVLGLYYSDVKFIVQTLFNLMLFLLPILYPSDNVYYSSVMQKYPWLYTLYMLNPITAMINAYRKTILEPVPNKAFNLKGDPLPMDWLTFSGACLICVLIAWSGYVFFLRNRNAVVERI
jgi:ABC-type polysaccharide/polyol phosphate export permease